MSRELFGHYFDYRFQRLTLTQALDTFGNTLGAIALAGTLFFSIPSGEARARVLLYLVFTMAPFAIVSALLGPVLDRGIGFRRLAVIVAGFGRCLICWWMATRTTSLYLFPLALGVLVGQRFYAITKTALVPTCLPPGESLVTANSFLTRVGATTGIAAAVVGALVHRILGVGAVLRLASLVYLAMGFFAFLLPAPRPAGGRRRIRMPGAAARDDDGPDPPDETVAPEPAHGVMLRPAFRAIGGLRALSGFLLFLLAFALRRDGASTTGFGVLLLGIGIGALVSSVGAPFLARRVREETLVAGAYFAAAAITLLTATWYSLAGAAFLAGIVGTSFGMAKLAFDSMAQRGLPRTIQGTLFARWEMAFQLCWVAGALIPVAININTRLALVAGGLAAAAGAVNYALEVARVRRAMASGRVPRAPMSGLRLPSI